jgi:hypothetical protein
MAQVMNDIATKIKAVNACLKAGEPGNISFDSFSGFTGYKPQFIVDALNEHLGIGEWGFEELGTEIVTTPAEKADQKDQVLAIAQVKVWLKDIEFHPVAWGQSRVTKGDIGDAKKGAQTDAIKKALSYFSVGNRAFYGQLQKPR